MPGLLGGLFGADNQGYNWFDQNRNALGQSFAGITGATSFGQGAQGASYGLLNGAKADQMNQLTAKQTADAAKKLEQAAEIMRTKYGRTDVADAVLSGGMDLSTAWNNVLTGMNSEKPKPIEVGGVLLDPETYQPIFDSRQGQNGQGGQVNYSTNPAWGVNAKGETVPIQFGDNGTTVASSLPDGITAIGPAEMAGNKAGATVDAKTQANAKAALPAAQNTANQTIQTIDALLNDKKGLEETFGKLGGILPQQWTPTMPGSSKADFRATLDQAQGQAFLQAREMLRGGGAITDYEGKRAEDAIARLSTAQSQSSFEQALKDFKQAVTDGYMKLQSTANGEVPAQMMPPSGSGGYQILGVE